MPDATPEVLPATMPHAESAALAPADAAVASPLLSMMSEAIKSGANLDALKWLGEQYQRERADRAKCDFFAALAAFQRECPPVHRAKAVDFVSSKGGRVHYTYAPMEVIAEAIKPALHKHGLSYTFTTALVDRRMDVTCHVRHAGGHIETASFPLPIMEGTGSMSESQKNGGTLTFGMRNALRMALGLTSTDEDTDARDPEDDAPISDEQVAEIETAMAEVRGDPIRFCGVLKVARLADIRQSQMPRVRQMLDAKRKQAMGGAA